MDPLTVLVAGGSGFIGRMLVPALAARGFHPLVLSRRRSAAREADTPVATWDGRSAGPWAAFVEGAFGIVNLSGVNIGSGRWTSRRRRAILASRVEPGRAIVEAVATSAVKPRVVIQASGVGFYGDRGDDLLDESSPAGTGFLADVVKAWEDSTRDVEGMGVRRAVTRSAPVFGRGGGVLGRLALPFRFFVGGPLGRGRQWMPWVHAADEVGAIVHLLENESLSGVFNVVAPRPLRERDLCRLIGRALRRPCWAPVPAPALRAVFGRMARETVLVSQRVLPRRLEASGYRFAFPEPWDALRDLLG